MYAYIHCCRSYYGGQRIRMCGRSFKRARAESTVGRDMGSMGSGGVDRRGRWQGRHRDGLQPSWGRGRALRSCWGGWGTGAPPRDAGPTIHDQPCMISFGDDRKVPPDQWGSFRRLSVPAWPANCYWQGAALPNGLHTHRNFLEARSCKRDTPGPWA